MEQRPNKQEAPYPERPILNLDLGGEQGNVFAVVNYTRRIVPTEEEETFRQEIQAATAPGAGKTYEDILVIVDSHVELIDVSESHPIYGERTRVQDATERYQRYVMGAVERLNEQIQTLPVSTPVDIDGMYPEFDDPDYSPQVYMVALQFEIGRVEGDIERSDSGEEREALEKYHEMLQECETALRRTGVM